MVYAYGKYSRLFLTKVNLGIHVASLVNDCKCYEYSFPRQSNGIKLY